MRGVPSRDGGANRLATRSTVFRFEGISLPSGARRHGLELAPSDFLHTLLDKRIRAGKAFSA